MGHRLAMGVGAVGSLLAAVGTAMPETLIPIVALIGGAEGSEDVAIGAIVGAPFLLATIAMALVGLAALGYKGRRDQGRHLEAHMETLERDLAFFLVFFGLALVVGIGIPEVARYVAGALFLVAYGFYVRATLRRGGDTQDEDSLKSLIVDPRNRSEPPTSLIVVQMVVGLAAMVGGAHLFVEELLHVAESLGVEALVLSLILAPLATELPEKANSFFWVRDGKDALALGNITGAMVFQSTIPIAVGLFLTDWDLDKFASASIALGLAGGVVAFFALQRRQQFNAPAVIAWAALYAAFLLMVLAS
jgi:cation:H+ antiporter